MGIYEIETDGGVYQIETQDPPDTSITNEILGIGDRAVEGVGALADFGDMLNRNVNPLYPGGPRGFGLNQTIMNDSPDTRGEGKPSETIKDTARSLLLYGDEQPNTPVGKVLGEVGFYAPNALIPGGAVPVLAGGTAAGITKAAGGSELQQAGAGLLGSFTPAALSSLYNKGSSVISRLFSPAAKQEAAQVAAKDIISKVANVDDLTSSLETAAQAEAKVPYIQRNTPEYLPQYQRTAEITGQPGIAALEETLRRSDDTVKQAATLQDALREEARASIFSKANPTPISDSEAGAIIRQGLEANKESLGEKVSKFAERAFIGGEELPAAAAKRVVTGTLNSFTKDGSRQVTPAFNNLVENFRALPSKVDLKTLQNYRSAFGKYAAPGFNATTEEKITAQVAGSMRKAIDTSIDTAIAKGELPQAQANAWRNMISTRAEKGALFESGGTRSALRKAEYNTGYKLASEKVPQKVLSTKEDAQQLVKALKGQTKSIQAARSSLLTNLWEKSTNQLTGNINPTTFNKQINLISEVAPEILTPGQSKALGKISQDLSSQATVKANAFAASKGNSITSEAESMIDILQGSIREQVSSKVRGVIKNTPLIGNMADAMISVISDPKERQLLLNKELASFVLNPKYAEALLKKPNPENVSLLKEFTSKISGALGVGVQTADRINNAGKDAQESIQTAENNPLFNPTSYDSGLFSMKAQPSLFNVVPESNLSQTISSEGENMYKGQPVNNVIEAVKLDPVDYAIMMTESNGNPKAKNPHSSASGLFQLINSTAKSLGVENTLDAGDNYDGYLKLKAENVARFGDDPKLIYAGHFLGGTLLDKYLSGKKLTSKEEALVQDLKKNALPRFERWYGKIIKEKEGVTEA